MNKKTIYCFGEIVWDSLPEGIFLGGAPLNVAYHLTQLGNAGIPISAIGDDFLGSEVIRRMKNKNVIIEQIQKNDLGTGVVIVELNEKGDARYEIRENVAWDKITYDEDLKTLVKEGDGFIYGSLSARSEETRKSLETLKSLASWKLCDVNLRPPYDDTDLVLSLVKGADWIKLNEEELKILAGEYIGEKSALERLAELSGVSQIVLTRGGDGAAVWVKGQYAQVDSPKVTVADTVGAGDAFTAAFVNSLLGGAGPEESLKEAVRLGGFVASKRGAQPEHP